MRPSNCLIQEIHLKCKYTNGCWAMHSKILNFSKLKEMAGSLATSVAYLCDYQQLFPRCYFISS
jgi:hypothetical protein